MFLLDTDTIIYSIKEHVAVHRNFLKYEAIPKSISVITYGELLHGALKSQRSVQNRAIVYRIADLFPIIPITRSVIEIFSEIKAALEKNGRTLDDMDVLIAATALNGNYTLVTNNESHFKRIHGLKTANWAS